jgi:NAD(P)-dependent dehydrogenase (short-subunit alcohol dehydrogenase family)
MRRLEGRSAIVTGGANGIGRAIAERFVAEGASVLIVDIDEAAGNETVKVLGDAVGGGARRKSAAQAQFAAVDVADGETMARAIDSWVDRSGRLDIVVNNAVAYNAANPEDGDVVSTPMAVWDRTYAVNVRGPMMTCKHAIPLMVRTAGGGVIVNVSSTSQARGDVNYVGYSSSKAALHAMTRSIAVSHARRGIRCNTVATGFVMTDAARRNVGAGKLNILRRSRLVDEPGTPTDIAALVSFLSSDEARYITGQAYFIEGGATANQPWYWGGPEGHPHAYDDEGFSGALDPRW